MFRKCDSGAEDLAKMTLKKWQKGVIDLPDINEIPVKGKLLKFYCYGIVFL